MWITAIFNIFYIFGFLCRKHNAQVYGGERQGPTFLSEPPNREEFLNSTGAVIPCSAYGKPNPQIRWQNEDGSHVTDLPGLRIVRLDGTLVFQPFRGDQYRQDIHAAVYKCTASNSVGTIVSRDVHVRAVMPQRYAVEMHDEFVLKGNTAVLKCHVPGFVKDFVSIEAWLKDSTELADFDSKSSRYSVFPTGELHIHNVQQSDSLSSYKCRTKHKLTGIRVSSSNPGRIIVTEPYGQVPPRITHSASRVLVMSGESVHLPCAGQAFPLPTFKWFRRELVGLSPVRMTNRKEMNGGTLILHKTGVHDSGKYVCVVASAGNEDKAETELIVSAPLSVNVFPHQRVADIGEVISFNCSVSGFPVTAVGWLKDNSALGSDGRIRVIARTQLLVGSVKREDRGMYQCLVSNEVDSAQGSAQLLIGDNPPEFLHTFDNTTVEPGSPVSLKCVASGNPLPQITWKLDGVHIPEDQSFRSGDYVTQDNTVVSYVNISRAGVEHAGEYSCTGRNDAGHVEHSRWVRVPGPPFVRSMKNQTIVAGESMKIRCPAGGHPIQTISWERDGVRLPDNHRQMVYPNGTLLVRQVERTVDEGKYTCTVRNKEGDSAQGSVFITVRVRPVIAPFILPPSVHMGQRYTIICTVIKGDPPMTIKWIRDNNPMPKDGDVRIHNLADYSSTLLFEAVKPEHRANYTCIASNEAGSTQHSAAMVIHVPPRWKTEPSDVSVIKGRGVMIDCEAEGFPPPRLTWRRAEGNVPESYKPISSSSHLHVFENGSLTILDVGEGDGGYYLCQASNGIGSGLSKVIKLSVHVAAHFTTKFHAEIAKKGQDANLVCEVYGERPLSILWTKDKQPLNPKLNDRYKVTNTVFNNGTLSKMSIAAVDRGDSALFTCLASNTYGKDETNIQLIIQEKPDIPQDLRVTRLTSRTVQLSWSPPYSGNSRLLKYLLHYEEGTDSNAVSSTSQDTIVSRRGSTKRVSIPPAETAWAISGLAPMKRYSFRISAMNALGESDPSNPVTVETEEEAPGGPPLSVTTSPVSSTVVKVKWEPPDASLQFGKVKGYYIGYKIKDSKDQYVYKTLEVGTNFKGDTLLTNLRRHTKYHIRVQAFNTKGAGPPTEDIVADTLKEDPPRPPALEILTVTSSSVTIKWRRDPNDLNPVTGFVIHYKREYGAWKEVEAPGDQDTYTVGNLQCGTSYDFYVTPYNAIGSGESSSVVIGKTSGRAPMAPEKEELVSINSTSISIHLDAWKSGGCSITHFEIQYKQQKHKKWILFADRVSPNQKVITISSMSPNTWYELQITAHNGAGPNEARYEFKTNPDAKGTLPDAVLVSGEALPFYLELEVILPVSLSLVVVVAVLVLVCLIVRKRNPSEISQTVEIRTDAKPPSSTYVTRKSHGPESVNMCEMEKSTYQRPVSRSDPIYYPTPYATTHIADGSCRKSYEASDRELQEEPQYATVKRTPRPPKSDVHIYHYPVHIPSELLDELQATSSHWSDNDRSEILSSGYVGRRSSRMPT